MYTKFCTIRIYITFRECFASFYFTHLPQRFFLPLLGKEGEAQGWGLFIGCCHSAMGSYALTEKIKTILIIKVLCLKKSYFGISQ